MEDLYYILTRDIILSLTTQEKIFERYLYKPDVKGSYRNPFRIDKRPGCTFYYKGKKLYFVDWAWDKKHYDCFNVAMEYYKCGITRALKHIKEDIEKGEIFKKTEADVQVERQKASRLAIKKRDYTPVELAFWNVGGLVITQEVLESSGIYCVDIIWESDWVIEHCKNTYAYVVDGIVQQIYFPKNKGTNRRRFISRREFTIGRVKELPFISSGAVIVNSKKCSFFMDQFDITNIFIVNESVIVPEDIFTLMETNYGTVFFLGDNDFPGKRLAVKMKQKYPSVVILLFPKGEPKDFTENLNKYGYQYINDLKQDIMTKFNL